MSIRKNEYQILDIIQPQNVLLSVFDKEGLKDLVDGLLGFNPEIMFYSTGNTGKVVLEVLGDSSNYTSVEDFTNSPEMEGGLVKTLHPKIHGGLLAEIGNPEHEKYLFETMKEMTGSPGVYFDIFVGNLYPFRDTISQEGATPEDARVNIDIGGPTMMMASAKNWHSVAVLDNKLRYSELVDNVWEKGGIPLKLRYDLAQDAMRTVGNYRDEIATYFMSAQLDEALSGLSVEGR